MNNRTDIEVNGVNWAEDKVHVRRERKCVASMLGPYYDKIKHQSKKL